MKKLPDLHNLDFRTLGFMDGANGMHEQSFYNDEYGITFITRQENRNSPWKTTITIKCLSGQVFKTAEELRAALEKNALKIPEKDVVNLNKGISGLAENILKERRKTKCK